MGMCINDSRVVDEIDRQKGKTNKQKKASAQQNGGGKTKQPNTVSYYVYHLSVSSLIHYFIFVFSGVYRTWVGLATTSVFLLFPKGVLLCDHDHGLDSRDRRM